MQRPRRIILSRSSLNKLGSLPAYPVRSEEDSRVRLLLLSSCAASASHQVAPRPLGRPSWGLWELSVYHGTQLAGLELRQQNGHSFFLLWQVSGLWQWPFPSRVLGAKDTIETKQQQPTQCLRLNVGTLLGARGRFSCPSVGGASSPSVRKAGITSQPLSCCRGCRGGAWASEDLEAL